MCGHYAHPVLRTPLVGCGAWQTSQAMTRTGQTHAYPVRHCERGNPVAWTMFPTPTRLPRFARNDQGKGARNYGLNTSGYASAEQTIAIGSLSKSDWLLWRKVCGEINRPIRRRQSARRCDCPTGKSLSPMARPSLRRTATEWDQRTFSSNPPMGCGHGGWSRDGRAGNETTGT